MRGAVYVGTQKVEIRDDLPKPEIKLFHKRRRLVEFFGMVVITVVEEAYYGCWHPFQVVVLMVGVCFIFLIGYFTGKRRMLNKRFDNMPFNQINNNLLLKKMKEAKERDERVTTVTIYTGLDDA